MPRKKSLPERRILWQKYLHRLATTMNESEVIYRTVYTETDPDAVLRLVTVSHATNADCYRGFEVGTLQITSISARPTDRDPDGEPTGPRKWRIEIIFRRKLAFCAFFVSDKGFCQWNRKRWIQKIPIYRSAKFSDFLPASVIICPLKGLV